MPKTECASSPLLLSDLETCQRKGYYSQSWSSHRLPAKEMVARALRASLSATGQQEWGELAGSEILQLAEDRGLKTERHEIYAEVMHNAALADIVVSAIRKPQDPAWPVSPPVQHWTSDCLMSPDGSHLRRIALVSYWNDDRHYSECRSWYTLGEMAHYDLPMQLVVIVIGQERNGRRLSPWVSGFLHPLNRTLRFRKQSRSTSEVFNNKWEKIYREDHAEITRETWLNAMLKDDVLPEVCFKVDIPLPEKSHCQKIRDIAARKLEQLQKINARPEPNLSSCDWPVPCVFRNLCWTLPEREPSARNGFIQIVKRTQAYPANSCK